MADGTGGGGEEEGGLCTFYNLYIGAHIPVAKYSGFGAYSMNKTRSGSKMFITKCGKLSEQVLNPFSNHFWG
jgi:hypothetical protein